MTDPIETRLREQARRLATDILRDPLLAYEYRQVVCDSYEDSNTEQMVTRWMTESGYATKHHLFNDELQAAPRTNLAAWDGGYVLEVDGREIVTMLLSVSGVTVAGERATHVSFEDGVLSFVAGEWRGSLRFESLAPPADRPLAEGGSYQRRCSGMLWRGAQKPASGNARGATARLELGPSPEHTPVRAAGLLGAAPSFVDAWKGDYKVTLVTANDAMQAGPDFGVAGSDAAATLSYVTAATVNLTDAAHRVGNRITYDAAPRRFALTFATFTENIRSFSGTIHPIEGPVPSTANASGISTPLPDPKPETTWSVATNVSIAIGAFLAGIAGTIVSVLVSRYSDKLAATREHEQAVAAGDGPAMQKTRDELNKLNDLLDGHVVGTTTNNPDAALFGEPVARRLWAAAEVKRIDAATTALAGRVGQTLLDIAALEAGKPGVDKALADAEAELDAKLKDDKATDREKADAKDVRDRAKTAADKLDKDLADRRSDRDAHKSERKKLEEDLARVHKLVE